MHDTVYIVEQYLIKTLGQLKRVKLDKLLEERYQKLRFIGGSGIAVGKSVQSAASMAPPIPEHLSIKAQLAQANRVAVN